MKNINFPSDIKDISKNVSRILSHNKFSNRRRRNKLNPENSLHEIAEMSEHSKNSSLNSSFDKEKRNVVLHEGSTDSTNSNSTMSCSEQNNGLIDSYSNKLKNESKRKSQTTENIKNSDSTLKEKLTKHEVIIRKLSILAQNRKTSKKNSTNNSLKGETSRGNAKKSSFKDLLPPPSASTENSNITDLDSNYGYAFTGLLSSSCDWTCYTSLTPLSSSFQVRIVSLGDDLESTPSSVGYSIVIGVSSKIIKGETDINFFSNCSYCYTVKNGGFYHGNSLICTSESSQINDSLEVVLENTSDKYTKMTIMKNKQKKILSVNLPVQKYYSFVGLMKDSMVEVNSSLL